MTAELLHMEVALVTVCYEEQFAVVCGKFPS